MTLLTRQPERFTPRAWLPLLAAASLTACAGAQQKPEAAQGAQLAEMQGQLRAQSALVADQQKRLEELEVRLASLTSKISAKEKATTKAAADKAANPVIEFDGDGKPRQPLPAAEDPRKKLETVRLEPSAPAKGRRPRKNPVERAPRLPTVTNLKEPEETELSRLAEPVRFSSDGAASTSLADRAFARAVQRLNDGDRGGAQGDLLAFAASHPRHAAADNAVYLAGLAASQSGNCPGALPLFVRVEQEYPAGDAVPQARLEEARCLLKLGRSGEAKEKLAALEKDHPDVPEASQARALLNGLY